MQRPNYRTQFYSNYRHMCSTVSIFILFGINSRAFAKKGPLEGSPPPTPYALKKINMTRYQFPQLLKSLIQLFKLSSKFFRNFIILSYLKFFHGVFFPEHQQVNFQQISSKYSLRFIKFSENSLIFQNYHTRDTLEITSPI